MSLSRIATLWLFLPLLLFLALRPVLAQEGRPLNPELLASKWNAYWIACPGAPAKEPGVYYFRKELMLAAVPAHYWTHVSADNRFILHVNGEYAAEGPARGDLFHWRFETVDLAPLLHAGRNVLAATVWNYGVDAPVAQMSDRTGFLVQGDTSAERAANTDISWKAERELSRNLIRHSGVSGYYAAGLGERVDARTLDWNWDDATQSSGDWANAEVIGRAATREAQDSDNSWELIQDPLPPMEHRLVEAGNVVRAQGLDSASAFPAAALTIPAHSHVTLLLDNTVLQTAYPQLIVSGGRDAVLRLTYAEALYDDQGKKGNRNETAGRHISGIYDEFVSDGKALRSFQPLWWRTWRYLQIDVSTEGSPLRLERLSAWFTAYPFEEKASIAADIPKLQQLWSTGWRTARLCAHETYMDAPYWEQLQYVGDTRIQALVSYAITGDSRLAKQAIENIDHSRVPEGLTQSRYPSRLPQFIPPFSLLWIGMLHDYWLYLDDLPLVRAILPHTRTVIQWYSTQQRPDGLLGPLNWWEFGDWTDGYKDGVPPQEADGGSALLTLQFIEALRDASDLELRYGSVELASSYAARAHKASDALNRLNWDVRYGLYADTPLKKTYSQQANALAVWLDVAPASQRAAIMRRVLGSSEHGMSGSQEHPVPSLSQASYYFRFYLARAMEHAGIADEYLNQLGPWYHMLDLGLSTWAENPEPTRSDCHAWSASPNYDLLTIVAGIHPGAPGFARVRIEPHLGKLTHLEASMPHPAGRIHVVYTRNSGNWSAAVDLPPGISGSLAWQGHLYPLHAGSQSLRLTPGR